MPALEVLSPAGDKEKLQMAVTYGADAVYLAGPSFGMRAGAGCFTAEEMAWAVNYCHNQGVKVYVACNTIPNDREMDELPAYLEQIADISADAIIAADVGVLELCRKYAPKMDIHISTQAGVMNSEAARFFYNLGANRVVLAREMSLEQIHELRQRVPAELEIESFCHGAMCVSFSGRCLLSAYMTGQDANQGRCAQPCRWKYYLTEEKRPGAPMELVEDGGTYLYNARDLCMIDHLPAMLAAGITSIKIEGRTKSAYYAAAVTNAYRHGADAAMAKRHLDPIWSKEVYKVSHRPYSTGFFFGQPGQYTADACYFSQYDVAAVVEECDSMGHARLSQRNRFCTGDQLELLMPGKPPISFTAGSLYDEENLPVPAANHPKMIFYMELPLQAPPFSFLRKQRTESISGHGIETEEGI